MSDCNVVIARSCRTDSAVSFRSLMAIFYFHQKIENNQRSGWSYWIHGNFPEPEIPGNGNF